MPPKKLPPIATRFKKGQSGNPKGRPKKLPKLDELLADVMGGAASNGVTNAESILRSMLSRAKAGDTRAAELLLDRTYGKQRTDIDLTTLGQPITPPIKWSDE